VTYIQINYHYQLIKFFKRFCQTSQFLVDFSRLHCKTPLNLIIITTLQTVTLLSTTRRHTQNIYHTTNGLSALHYTKTHTKYLPHYKQSLCSPLHKDTHKIYTTLQTALCSPLHKDTHKISTTLQTVILLSTTQKHTYLH
jgi:hypothetical protein